MRGTPIPGTMLGTIWRLSNCFYRDRVNEPKSAEVRDSALRCCEPTTVYVPEGWPDYSITIQPIGEASGLGIMKRGTDSLFKLLYAGGMGCQGAFVRWKFMGFLSSSLTEQCQGLAPAETSSVVNMCGMGLFTCHAQGISLPSCVTACCQNGRSRRIHSPWMS